MGEAAETIWRFIWHEFCDVYVEGTKIEENRATRAAVLSFVWNNAMRLLHPIAPFVSEEVWLAIPHDGQTIMTATWPDPLEIPVDEEAAATFEALTRAAERVRTLRATIGLHPKERIDVEVPENVPSRVASALAHLATANVRPVGTFDGTVADALARVVGRAPRAVLFERYRKDADRLRGEVERLERKLGNSDFVAKAAPDVVAKEREKLAGYRNDAARVETELASLRSQGDSA